MKIQSKTEQFKLCIQCLTNTERLLVQSNILNSEYDLYLSALKNSPNITIILYQKV